ncbi:recombinase RecA [Burkholderia pseudomallei]|nr:recombinase RecA [Burkholderia pseudomallei]
MSASSLSLESLHPSLWRGSQLARGGPRTVDTGYAALSVELPGGGWPLDALLWLRASSGVNALWAAEQALRTGCCGALLLWHQNARADALRRLHLAAARAGDTLFVMFRPLAAAQQPSPAVLRLALHPSPGGVSVEIVKRRGPARGEPLALELPSPIVESRYARLARHPSAAPAARRVRAAVA